MDKQQAVILVGVLQAHFPVPELPPSTVATWSELLLPLAYDETYQAIKNVARRGTNGRPIQIADVISESNDIWRERFSLRAPEIQRAELEATVAAAPDFVRDMLAEYFARMGERNREEAARDLAHAQDFAAEQTRPTRVGNPALLRTACGVRVGARADWDEARGAYVCPKCRCLVSEGCAPQWEARA